MKNKKLFIAIIFFLILVPILLFLTLSSGQNFTSIFKRETVNGISKFDAKLTALNTDKNIASDTNYSKATGLVKNLENNSKLSKKEKYDVLKSISDSLNFLYSNTNNPKVKDVYIELGKIAKSNMSDLYSDTDFAVVCQDPTCQDTPEAPEITKVVDEIKNSNVEDYAKQAQLKNLENAKYLSGKNIELKVFNYYIISTRIVVSGAFTKAGVNVKIANEIWDYLTKKYPDITKKYVSPDTIYQDLLSSDKK